jgi:hypothetical protein
MRHPSRDRTHGLIDLIYSSATPPRSPIESAVTSTTGSGTSFSPDVTGAVGGLDEINANAGQLQSLVAALRKLAPVGCD